MAVIEVRGVAKRFRIPSVRRDTFREHALDLFRPRAFETLQVLDASAFDVQRGETLGIMGRNGCGKSTLLQIISGIYRPDAGLVRRARRSRRFWSWASAGIPSWTPSTTSACSAR